MCNCTEVENNEGLIEINITEGLKNRKDIPLSKLVKDVEVLELEANKDCYMQIPRLWYFGKRYILVFDQRDTQVFLFNRKGEFIRRIGQQGKGPGEYSGWLIGTMDKSENHVIISDMIATRVIVYDLQGEVLAQKDLSRHFPSGFIDQISSDIENRITFLPRRPVAKMDGFSSLILFDMNLEKVADVLPREADSELAYRNLNYQNLFTGKDGAFFWETFKDTVYQYYEDGSNKAKYRFVIDKNGLTSDVLKKREFSNIYDYTLVMSVNFLPDRIVAWILSPKGFFIPVFYEFKTGETYSIGRNSTCRVADYNPPVWTSSIENDIYGIEPPMLVYYYPDQKLCIKEFEWGVNNNFMDMDCIKQLKLSHPDIRDQLVGYCENPSEDLGLVMILMHMK